MTSWLKRQKPPKFRAVQSPHASGLWWIQERMLYGWTWVDTIRGRDNAQAHLNRIASPEVLYPETKNDEKN